jgi:hypothetical protein
MHISKALKARSKSIQRALHVYNQAATGLDPPRPKLTWAQIVEYTTIAEFELLRSGAREDIRNLEWADARNREATIYHLKMARAREEIKRLNIEIKRLATWIADEEQILNSTIKTCMEFNPVIAGAITDFSCQRKRVNNHLRNMLMLTYSLPGYSGETDLGDREVGDETKGLDDDSDAPSDNEKNAMLDDLFNSVLRMTLED